ncbi:MAG: NAD-dependent epimerase/dehydratase family protein [Pleomorphochaeta sp.]
MYYNNKIYQNDLLSIINDNNLSKLNDRSILITGASGMIGSVIVDALLFNNEQNNTNIKIFALSRNTNTLKNRFISNINNKNLIFIQQDISNDFNFDYNFDYIIHAASNAYPKAFSQDPVGTIIANVNGVKNLLDYSKTHGLKRFLYISSGEVYGQGDSNIDSFDEKYSGYVDNTNARSCYPNAKRTSETLCIAYKEQYSIETLIARPCHIYGASTTKKDNRATAQFINNVINDKNIVMKSNGLQLRSYCYISDCVSAIIKILFEGKTGNAYNISNKKSNVTIRELAQTLAKCNNKKVIFENPSDIELKSYNPVTKSVLNSSKLEELKWAAKVNLKEGLQRTIDILLDK